MRILFVLKGLALVRHFHTVVAHLADAGHQVILAPTKFGDEELLPATLASHPNCSVLSKSVKRADALNTVAILRGARDYLRYQEPALAGAEANRRRALAHLVRVVSHGTRELPDDLPDRLVPLNRHEVRRLREAFDEIEGFIPTDRRFEQFIASQRPDVVLITPLVSFGGLQSDFVKAARALRIPSACLVFSWDNLSNKGVMHERPDQTFVWNEVQRREAIELHQVAPEAVVATGAPRFDPFYEMTSSETRAAFCERLGLDADKRLVVYLGSSPIVSPHEPVFADRWLQALRVSAAPALRDAQIVIRPHPRVTYDWPEHPQFVTAQPDGRALGLAITDSRSAVGDQTLFDTLYHADAVVGLNTTAELEAGVLGKPVYTIRATEFAAGQTGSYHFYHLLREHGGFVECADTLDQHLTQLAEGLAGRFDPEAVRSFTAQFLRPHGRDTPVSPLLASEIERWAERVTAASTATRSGASAAVKHTDARRPVNPEPLAPDEPVKTQVVYDRHPLFILVSTDAEREWRLDPGRKEPWTVAWLDDNVKPGDVVYDVGANVGVFSLIAAANLEGRGTVVAFEPGYANFSRLCENIRLNRFTSRIIPTPLPLSNRSELQCFRYRSLEPGQSRHSLVAKRWDPVRRKVKSSEQPVLALALDQAVRDFGFPLPTHIKLDVDGSEDLVLRGAGALLQNETLRSVAAEIDPACETAVLERLARAGLRLTDRFKRKKKPGAWYGVFQRSR